MSKKILVVDDDASVREMLDDFLSGLGYEIVTAENGLKALELITEGGFDMLITDLQMPEMDGYSLVMRVRDVLRLEKMPILMMSALSSEEQLKKSAELVGKKKINFLMPKPLPLADLRRIIKETLKE